MLRIIVDSGSSIKQEEKDQYGVDILPVRLNVGNEHFLDGYDLDMDEFYRKLKKAGQFPKTSLPSLETVKELVRKYTDAGDEVLVITISSEISGTWQALKILFRDNKKVTVFDSRLAVGGIRFLVEEAHRYDYEPVQAIVDRLKRLVPRIVIAAIPETLDYLLAGGRLSKTGWMFGTVLAIKPVIGFAGGKVAVTAKKRGKRQAMRYLAECVKEGCCDPAYGIIASYTFNKANIDEVIRLTCPESRKLIKIYDNISPSIACHWGPNAFGYIFVKPENFVESLRGKQD